jgi:O-antigen/teichoic acid export membrane protein
MLFLRLFTVDETKRMLKRLVYVALYTGLGHLLTVFTLKYIAQQGYSVQLNAIAEIDSLFFFMMIVIALGLQSTAMRDLAQAQDWKKEYYQTQSARFTLSLLIMPFAALAFFNTYYLIFLLAPIFAWNGDYAMYARGYSITAAFIAFLRLLIPFSLLIAFSGSYPEQLALIYIVSLTGIYAFTNMYISRVFKASVFLTPRLKDLRLYSKSLPLGIVVLSLYFIGLGLILIIPYFYTSAIVAIAFAGLKFYMIFKGILRMIHQTFIKEMMDYKVCFKVDQLSSLIGLTFCSFIICFPNTSISLFFGSKYISHKTYFILLSVAGLIYSLFSSLIIKAMLDKKDKAYASITLFSALFTILVCIILSYIHQNASSIGISLMAGEITFAICMLAFIKRPEIIIERSIFLFKNVFIVALPLIIKYLLGDKPLSFIMASIVFLSIIGITHYKKFNTPLHTG